jgi:hypothetical protein
MNIRYVEQQFRSLVLDYDGYTADENTISLQTIYKFFLKARSRFYGQKISNRKRFNPISIQSLACIELKESDQNECPSTAPSGCTWRESIKAIPTPIKIITVTNDIGTVNYEYVPWNRCRSIGRKRRPAARKGCYFTHKQVKEGFKLFVVDDHLENISMTLIADDPLKAIIFCNPDAACDKAEQEVHTTQEELEVICKLAIADYAQLHGLRAANRDEQTNDKKD